eukprot:15483039-Alexandrium_andersonii.AAC.1
MESYAWRYLSETMPQQYSTFKRNKHELLEKMRNGWSMTQWTDEVQAALSSYLAQRGESTEHIGFHVRRTDYQNLSNNF